MSKEENDAIIERLRSLRKRDPERYALLSISVKWDSLNAEYRKNGISASFALTRKELKSRIAYYKEKRMITDESLKSFCDSHPDIEVKSGGKTVRIEHGYNFRYTQNIR